MKSDEMSLYRKRYNDMMMESDEFFREFSEMDDGVYSEGAITKKNKELMGLAISVTTRCNECILYHLDGSIQEGANKAEIIEAIKIGVIAGGSITFPNARFAFEMMNERK
ncbi:MAG: carboxymuconolactone decarboxylase family protein [Bacillaceae bacterium]|nr:carboxymuconolactone decarboxylase family protein [Bacillaceae bacterium]